MAELNVLFEVPLDIVEGLNSGIYERIGGVIRRVGDKTVVAWLRDGIPVGSESTQQLLSQGAQQTQMMRVLGMQQQVMMGLQVANLAVSAVGFAVLYYKLDAVQKTLGRMESTLAEIKAGQDWLDNKQMLAQSAPIYKGLRGLKEAKLFENSDVLKVQLMDCSNSFSDAYSYFHNTISKILEREEAHLRPQELSAAYRAWIMAGQGGAQVMAELGEMGVAIDRVATLKSDHAQIGQQLQSSLSNPLNRLKDGANATQAQNLLLGLAQQAVGAHEIFSGQILQLECIKENQWNLRTLEKELATNDRDMLLCRVT